MGFTTLFKIFLPEVEGKFYALMLIEFGVGNFN